MVVYGIIGRPNLRLGAGKSTLLTYLALIYNRKFGQTIRANYHLKKEGAVFVTRPRELLDVFNSFIALDDIYRWLSFDGRKSKRFSKLMAGELRHHTNNLGWGSSRTKDYVHKSLRDHTDYFIFPKFEPETQTLTVDYVLNAEGDPVNGVIPRYFPTATLHYIWSFYNHREDILVTDDF